MKKIYLFIFFGILSNQLTGQTKRDDFGRIILASYVPEISGLPEESRQFLISRISQVASNYGIGSNDPSARFVIAAKVNVLSKDIIPGPPQRVAQQLEFILSIADSETQAIFSSISFQAKGIGNNENQAIIDAIKRIDISNPKVKSILEEGKNKILSYYSSNCDFILKTALTDSKSGKYDKAIYDLSMVPEVCQSCYFKSLDTLTSIYQRKINEEGRVIVSKANSIWAAKLNVAAAEEIGDLLTNIDPNSSAQKDAANLVAKITAKLKADERARWQFKLKQYQDRIALKKESMRIAEEKSKRDAIASEKSQNRNFELDKMRINSYREVAITYAKNQPKQIISNRYIFLR
jgi:ubiquitin-protein ligase